LHLRGIDVLVVIYGCFVYLWVPFTLALAHNHINSQFSTKESLPCPV
jgi:hypothetical protein